MNSGGSRIRKAARERNGESNHEHEDTQEPGDVAAGHLADSVRPRARPHYRKNGRKFNRLQVFYELSQWSLFQISRISSPNMTYRLDKNEMCRAFIIVNFLRHLNPRYAICNLHRLMVLLEKLEDRQISTS